MQRYFMYNSGILRRSISFLLACLFLLLALPAAQRAKAEPITTTDHYEWKQIRTQADIPAKGTYPMLLCYTDLNGQNWFLTGNSPSCAAISQYARIPHPPASARRKAA